MIYSFYRPHFRVTEDNTFTDPVTGEIVTMPSMTKQEFQAECDINNVIKAFSRSGMFHHVAANAASGVYMDLPQSVDFQDALHLIKEAGNAFATLPSALRARFDNDPAQFLAFTHDPANLAEMRTLGLAVPLSPNATVEPQNSPSDATGGAGGTPPAGGA